MKLLRLSLAKQTTKQKALWQHSKSSRRGYGRWPSSEPYPVTCVVKSHENQAAWTTQHSSISIEKWAQACTVSQRDFSQLRSTRTTQWTKILSKRCQLPWGMKCLSAWRRSRFQPRRLQKPSTSESSRISTWSLLKSTTQMLHWLVRKRKSKRKNKLKKLMQQSS